MGKIFTFSGPRGVGKTSILNDLQERCGINPIVPYTTRPPRPGEIDGVDYRFVGEEEFHALRSNAGGMFDVLTLGGNHYGTPYSDFEKVVIEGSDKDVSGLRTVNLAAPTALNLRAEFGPMVQNEGDFAVQSLFILPRSYRDIRRQMRDNGVPEGQIEERLKSEPTDLTLLPEFDSIIVNGYGRREEAFQDAKMFISAVANVALLGAQQPAA